MSAARHDQTTRTRLIGCGVRRPPLRLSALDIAPGGVAVPRAAAFAYRVDLERLLDSLRGCLRELPFFCGRLIKTADGWWAVDVNDAGIQYTVVEVDAAMPPYGYRRSMKPDMHRLTEPLAFAPVGRDRPLVGIRVTRFRDGTVVGVTNNHALTDGAGAWLFLDRWSQHFRGQPADGAPTFDRAPLLSPGESRATTGAGPLPERPLSPLGLAGFIARSLLTSRTGATAVFHLPAAALANHKSHLSARLPAGEWISTQDVAMSLMLQAVAAATVQERLQTGTIYDIRKLPELGLAAQYVGNAATARAFVERSSELARDPLTAARTLRRLAATVTGDRMRAELRHDLARITPSNALRHMPPFIRDQFADGLLLNNYSRFPIYRADFGGGPPIWGDYPRLPLHRVITLCPDPTGDGVAVHLTLPRTEMRRLVRPEGAGVGGVVDLRART